MKKKPLLLGLLTLILTVFFYSEYHADAFMVMLYNLKGGIYNRYYTVPSNANYTYNQVTHNYGSIIDSVVTRWNDRVDPHYDGSLPEDIHFIKTSDYSKSQIDYYVYEYSFADGWVGVTEYYSLGKGQLSPQGVGPSENWDYCKIKLDVTSLHSLSYNLKFQATAHEFGHALGLAHSNTTSAVMWRNSQGSVEPTTDDERGIRFKY